MTEFGKTGPSNLFQLKDVFPKRDKSICIDSKNLADTYVWESTLSVGGPTNLVFASLSQSQELIKNELITFWKYALRLDFLSVMNRGRTE